MTFCHGLENNHACKWIPGKFSEISEISEVCMHDCFPIHGGRPVFLLKSVFEIIGKSHYWGQKRTQRLRCAIL